MSKLIKSRILFISQQRFISYVFIYFVCCIATTYLFTYDSYEYTTHGFSVFLDRPFILPLANMLMLDLPPFIVVCQSIILAISWWFFANTVSKVVHNQFYRNLLFICILLFSFSHSIIRWGNAIESESYCMSANLVIMSLLFSKQRYNFLIWFLGLVFFIFTRDTNAYLLPFLLPILYFRLKDNKKLCIQILLVSIILATVNILMCLNSTLRSREPMYNNFQSRVFLNESLIKYFHEKYAMPIPLHVGYHGDPYDVYNILPDYRPDFNLYTRQDLGFNPPKFLVLYNLSESQIIANAEFESWFKVEGKKSFTKYLITNGFFLKDVITKYYNFVFFIPKLNNYNYIYNPSYTSGLTKTLIMIGFIFNNLLTVGLFFIASCLFCLIRYRLIWLPRTIILADCSLILGFFSNSVISFWGSGMEFTRHCFIPATSINLLILVNCFLICAFSLNKYKNFTSN